MVGPLLTPIVMDRVHHCLESVVYFLEGPPLDHGKPPKLPFKKLYISNLDDLVTFIRDLEDVLNLVCALQTVHLVVLLPT